MSSDSTDNSAGGTVSPDVRRILDVLSEQDKVLIVCNYELYGGRWDLLQQDLQDRLEGRPYVLKLGERFKEDIERVKRLAELEKRHGFKFGDFVTL